MACPLINLCDPVFKTIVNCSSVSSEGYEVTNLISGDTIKRKRGFLSDRFIKPPVEISLKFPFDVNIRFIQIGAEVGQQKSNGLEIYSSSVPYNSSLCSGRALSQPRSKSSLICSPSSERIALVHLKDGEKGVVVFCPLQYGRSSPRPVPNIRADFVQRTMAWKNRSVIAHTSSLTLRIFKTLGSSVPAVGSIDVWGEPSSCMPFPQVSHIIDMWISSQGNGCSDEKQEVFEEPKPTVSTFKKNDKSILEDTPEEFLDAITCEIMALPMVLPSGKVVDQQTLDLHAQAEADWGRHPSDPFTGIMFSDGCRPVLDSALKSRIDRFLVLNQDRKDLKTVPRTVGRAQPQICHQSVSRFLNVRVSLDSTIPDRKRSVVGSFARSSIGVPPPGFGQGENLPSCSSYQNFSKPDKMEDPNFVVKKAKQDASVSSRTQGERSKQECPPIIDLDMDQKCSQNDNTESHEKKLDDSLDFALKAVLSGLPSFLNPCDSPVIIKNCGSCKVTEGLYQLPCTHFMCRLCLIKVKNQSPSVCQTCHVEFKSCDPVYYHK